MIDEFSRTELLLGSKATEKLSAAKVAVFGIGGVGGYVCEALVRSGVKNFELIDNDVVSITNINRQIIATHSTIGRQKTEVMKERMQDINPSAEVSVKNCFYTPENAREFDFSKFDYIVDAIDTVTSKIELVLRAQEYGVPIISCMGAGNKLDATAFKVSDIYKTKTCPLAKVMRRELKKRGVKALKVVYSEEMPINIKNPDTLAEEKEQSESLKKRRSVPGSVSFVPSVAGLIIAGEVIKDLIK